MVSSVMMIMDMMITVMMTIMVVSSLTYFRVTSSPPARHIAWHHNVSLLSICNFLQKKKNISRRQNQGQKPFFQSEQWNCFLLRQGLSQGCDTLPNVAHIFAFSRKNYKISWVTCPPGINFCICICICIFSSSTFLLPRVCRCCPPRMRESFCLGTAWLYRS